MSDCRVPWHCELCGQRGEIVVGAAAMEQRETRLRALVYESFRNHGHHMLMMRYDWPDCWKEANRSADPGRSN